MEDAGYRKLHWKIVATTLSFSLVPLMVLGWSIYTQFKVSYTARIMENLKTLTENRQSAMDLFFDERVSQLSTIAYTHTFSQLASDEYLNRVFTLMQTRSKSFVDLGIIDGEGDHVAYVGPYNLKGVNYKSEEWFHEVMLRGVYISDVFMGFRRFPHFIIAVMRREGDNNWILRATIDTDIFESMVEAAQIGRRGDAYVVNRDFLLQTRPRFGGELLTRQENLQLTKFTGARVQEMVENGREALYGFTWLKNKDWLLVIREDPHEELMPLMQGRLLAIGLGAGGILVIVMGTLFVSRQMISHLVEADREKAILDASLVQSSKMAALGKLAAGIAHEVNNPLAVIKEKVGWIRDLLDEEDVTSSPNLQEFEDAVKKIDAHVERAKKVIHRLLGFARGMEPVREKVDVERVMEGTLEFLRNEAHYRNIEIKTQYAGSLPETLMDSTQLQQVFLNILNNAIDAVARDGWVSVQTSRNDKDREILVTISDNGPGISSDLLAKIFDPFFTTKELGKGTGLGLSISYSIIEKLGGAIKVESEVGKGTTFTIHLPVITPDKV